MAASLTPRELFKYEWRVEKFLSKFRNGEYFKLTNNCEVKFLFDPIIERQILSNDRVSLRGLVLLSDTGIYYRFSDLIKTAEFGGKGAGSGTIIEDQEVARLRRMIQFPIQLDVNGSLITVHDIASTPGTPRSDFHFLDEEGNEVLWASHKAGTKPSDFQQWAGMTAEQPIRIHPEVVTFVDDMKTLFGSTMPRATTIARNIQCDNLKLMSIYGPEFGNATSRHNVSLVLQGSITISANHIQAHKVHQNGDLIGGGYEPVLMAMYKGDRSNFDIAGARFAVQPRDSRAARFL